VGTAISVSGPVQIGDEVLVNGMPAGRITSIQGGGSSLTVEDRVRNRPPGYVTQTPQWTEQEVRVLQAQEDPINVSFQIKNRESLAEAYDAVIKKKTPPSRFDREDPI
jgi:hypothetical protein